MEVDRPFDELPAGWIAFESQEDDIFLGHCCSAACFAKFEGKAGVEVIRRA